MPKRAGNAKVTIQGIGYFDSDWANDSSEPLIPRRRCFFVPNSAVVFWKFRNRGRITVSTLKVKFIAFLEASTEVKL
jgi:hypothetical protein